MNRRDALRSVLSVSTLACPSFLRTVSARTRFSIGACDWSIGPARGVKLRLNVDNLLDEDYLGTVNTTVSTAATYRPAPPRTIQLSLTANF